MPPNYDPNNQNDQPAPPPMAPPADFESRIPPAQSLETKTTFVQKVGRSPKLRMAVFALVFAGMGSAFLISSFAASAKPSLILSAKPTATSDGQGRKTTISWSSSNIKVGTCLAQSSSNVWSGKISDSGSKVVTLPSKAYGPYYFSYNCTSPSGGGAYSNNVTVRYNP